MRRKPGRSRRKTGSCLSPRSARRLSIEGRQAPPASDFAHFVRNTLDYHLTSREIQRLLKNSPRVIYRYLPEFPSDISPRAVA